MAAARDPVALAGPQCLAVPQEVDGAAQRQRVIKVALSLALRHLVHLAADAETTPNETLDVTNTPTLRARDIIYYVTLINTADAAEWKQFYNGEHLPYI